VKLGFGAGDAEIRQPGCELLRKRYAIGIASDRVAADESTFSEDAEAAEVLVGDLERFVGDRRGRGFVETPFPLRHDVGGGLVLHYECLTRIRIAPCSRA